MLMISCSGMAVQLARTQLEWPKTGSLWLPEGQYQGHLPWLPNWLDGGALINVDAPPMLYVSGSRPGGAQVGRFSSWGTVTPKASLTKVQTSCHV